MQTGLGIKNVNENPYAAPNRDRAKSLPLAYRAGIASFVFACAATGLFVLVAAHAHIDRTHRQPKISWEGPLAAWIAPMEILGWSCEAVAAILAFGALAGRTEPNARRAAFAWLALAIVQFSVFGNCLFWIAAKED